MEWCVPSGAYDVKLFDDQACHKVSCALEHGDAVDIQLLPTRQYQLALTALITLVLGLTGLMVATLLDVIDVNARVLGLLLLLLVLASGWCWLSRKTGFCVKVTGPFNP